MNLSGFCEVGLSDLDAVIGAWLRPPCIHINQTAAGLCDVLLKERRDTQCVFKPSSNIPLLIDYIMIASYILDKEVNTRLTMKYPT